MADLRSELLAVREQYGALTAEAVVMAATPADAPLHDRFEWDDSEAAHRYRLAQARQLIRVVREIYVDAGGRRQRVRYFHAVPQEVTGPMAYQPVDEILEDPMVTKILLAAMERDWRALRARYDRLREFREIVMRDMAGESGDGMRQRPAAAEGGPAE